MKSGIARGVWQKCRSCDDVVYTKELESNLKVCKKCGYHFRLNVSERISLLIDEGSFVESGAKITASDPLQFFDLKSYKDRVKDSKAKTKKNEAIVTGHGLINGKPVCLGVLNFEFMGGSMGSVVGEKIVRLTEKAIREKLPVIIVSASGGARMQESMFSLLQMAKTSAALARLEEEGLLYISILTDPTTGGVTASFAMLGDINIAEPNALIAFAGPRVIEQTIRQKLPKGFQRSEFLLEHGMIDRIVPRSGLKDMLSRIIEILG